MILAAFLGAVFFYFVRHYAIGTTDNTTNAWVFTSSSSSNFQLDDLYDVWKGRLSALLLTGWLFDFVVQNTAGGLGAYCSIFALYQTLWLFLLFLTIILALRRSLIINLGIFVGVMYNFLPASGLYFYPWDLPATLFFTLAVLLFQQRQGPLMVATICVGCFFKETVLVCALLVFFYGGWPWWRRILIFAGIAAAYLLGKKLLLAGLHVSAAALSMNDATNLPDLAKTGVLEQNLNTLFSTGGLYVVFCNAGSLVAVLLFGWQRRFLPFMVLILAFVAGQSMFGAFSEFRIFMQILPVSLIILTERLVPVRAAKPAKSARSARPSPPAEDWAVRGSVAALPRLALLLVCFSTAATLGCYGLIVGDSGLTLPNQTPLADGTVIPKLERLATWYQNGQQDADRRLGEPAKNPAEIEQLKLAGYWFGHGNANTERKLAAIFLVHGRQSDALAHYRLAMRLYPDTVTNSAGENNNLAWILATAEDAGLRDGNEAVLLAGMACQQRNYQDANPMDTLAAAYAESGRFDDACAMAKKAGDVAFQYGQANMAAGIASRLKLYEVGKPYHEAAVPLP